MVKISNVSTDNSLSPTNFWCWKCRWLSPPKYTRPIVPTFSKTRTEKKKAANTQLEQAPDWLDYDFCSLGPTNSLEGCGQQSHKESRIFTCHMNPEFWAQRSMGGNIFFQPWNL